MIINKSTINLKTKNDSIRQEPTVQLKKTQIVTLTFGKQKMRRENNDYCATKCYYIELNLNL